MTKRYKLEGDWDGFQKDVLDTYKDPIGTLKGNVLTVLKPACHARVRRWAAGRKADYKDADFKPPKEAKE